MRLHRQKLHQHRRQMQAQTQAQEPRESPLRPSRVAPHVKPRPWSRRRPPGLPIQCRADAAVASTTRTTTTTTTTRMRQTRTPQSPRRRPACAAVVAARPAPAQSRLHRPNPRLLVLIQVAAISQCVQVGAAAGAHARTAGRHALPLLQHQSLGPCCAPRIRPTRR